MHVKTGLRFALLLSMSLWLFLSSAATGICALMCMTNTCPGCATWAVQAKAPTAQAPEKPCCCKHGCIAEKCSTADGASRPSCCKFKTPQLAVNVPGKAEMPVAVLTVVDLPRPALPVQGNSGNEYIAAVPELKGHSPPPIVPHAPDLGRAPPVA